MISGGITIHTAHGYSVTVRRRGVEYDLETRDPRGNTISTVEMSEHALRVLFGSIGESLEGV